MLRPTSKLLFIFLIALPFSVLALPSDQEQPIEIEADHAQLDDQRGITQYKGKAILTQGTLRIEGDIITFYYDKNKQITKIVAQGNLASYSQVHKKGEAPITAKASQMEFHAQLQKIYLVGKGVLWQNGTKFQGEHIEYDIAKNIVNVSGQKDPDKPTDKPGRIHIIIQPPGKSASIIKPSSSSPKPTSVSESLKNDEGHPLATTLANLNVRTGPGTQYAKLGLLPLGSEIIILTEQKNWRQIRGIIKDETVIGWINKQYIQLK